MQNLSAKLLFFTYIRTAVEMGFDSLPLSKNLFAFGMVLFIMPSYFLLLLFFKNIFPFLIGSNLLANCSKPASVDQI